MNETSIWHTCEKCGERVPSSIEITRNGIDVCCSKCGMSYFMRFA